MTIPVVLCTSCVHGVYFVWSFRVTQHTKHTPCTQIVHSTIGIPIKRLEFVGHAFKTLNVLDRFGRRMIVRRFKPYLAVVAFPPKGQKATSAFLLVAFSKSKIGVIIRID